MPPVHPFVAAFQPRAQQPETGADPTPPKSGGVPAWMWLGALGAAAYYFTRPTVASGQKSAPKFEDFEDERKFKFSPAEIEAYQHEQGATPAARKSSRALEREAKRLAELSDEARQLMKDGAEPSEYKPIEEQVRREGRAAAKKFGSAWDRYFQHEFDMSPDELFGG